MREAREQDYINIEKANAAKRAAFDFDAVASEIAKAYDGRIIAIKRPKPGDQISRLEHQCECGCRFMARHKDSRRGLAACPECSKSRSNGEREVESYVQSLGFETVANDRTILGGKDEIDILIPSRNFGIEFNGLWHHRENKHRHAWKYAQAKEAGIRLIQIYDDEWRERRSAVENVIRHALGVSERIGARKLKLRKVPVKSIAGFFEANHVQGAPIGGFAYVLMEGDNVISAMSFSKPYSIRHASGEGQFELSRFVSSKSVAGAATRLWKAFIKDVQPDSVVTYADHRYFDGGIFARMGFTAGKTSVDYEYYIDSQRRHKSAFQKGNIAKIAPEIYDPKKTERQMMKELGAVRVYNAGRTTYVYGSAKAPPIEPDALTVKDVVSEVRAKREKARRDLSAARKELWADPDFRSKAIEAKKKYGSDPQFKEKMSDITKGHWDNPEYRKKTIASRSTPEAKAKRVATFRAKGLRRWQHPDHGQRVAWWKEMREEFGGGVCSWKDLASGKRKEFKGWTVEKIETDSDS